MGAISFEQGRREHKRTRCSMINESPHRGLNAAGAEADQSGQSQFAVSAPSLQLIGRALNEAEEASSPLVAALAYVQAGLRVFPCSPQDKSPLVAHGCKAASKDPTQIRTWWKRWPNAMIALATGPHNGIFVLDVDVDLEKGIGGFASLAALEMEHGKLPETLRSVTPRGGMHLYFAWRDGIKNSVGKLGVGLDVRATGGSIIAPPSRRSDGQSYRWTETSAPAPIEAPQWLVDLLLTPKQKPAPRTQPYYGGGNTNAYARAALEDECAAVATAQCGTRNDSLNRASFSLGQFIVTGALTESEVINRLSAACVANGLVDDDGIAAVRATIESGLTAGLKEPRAIPQRQARTAVGNYASTNKEITRADGGLHFTLYRDIERAPRKIWLVENFLGAGELSCYFGPPGCGKSVLAGDLAAHIAAGRTWFGRRVTQGAVLYVAAERAALVRRRFAAWRLSHDINDIPLAILSGTIDLRSTRDAERIVDLMHRLEDKTGQKGVLIEIDTVSRVLAGGDENSSKEVGALIGSLAHIQNATSAAIGLLHHVPHDQQRMRGHGALLAACDTTVHIENAGGSRTGRIDKTNDGAEDEMLAFTFISVELYRDPDSGQITTAPVVQPVDGAPPKTRTKEKLTKAAQIALRALQEAIIELGETLPPSNHIPSGKLVVSLETWRQYSYRAGVSTSDDGSAKRKAFQRASEHLIAACRVGFYDEKVWLP